MTLRPCDLDRQTTTPWGRFTGPVQAEFVRESGEDRRMRLLRTVSFVDADGERWVAPRGLVFDGASIPRALWSVTGAPFDGDYRDAAVFHDAAYKRRDPRGRKAADQMFYAAMRASGVGAFRARKMYLAVRWLGRGAWAAVAGTEDA
jgi:hypothetical protein